MPLIQYCPKLQLFTKRPGPAHVPYGYELLSKLAYDAAGVYPGKRSNVRLLEMDKDAFFYEEALPGQSPFKPRILNLDNDLQFFNWGANQWIIVHTDEEDTARQEAVDNYQAIVNRLLVVPADKRTPEQLRQLAGAKDMLEQLSTEADSFLISFDNLYESGATGIIWRLSVPNVPVDFVSKQQLGPDNDITLRVLRAAPLEEQGNHDLVFKLTNGPTQYALVFGKENSVKWLHFRNMTAAKRAGLEAKLRDVEDRGRLTGKDLEQIREWKKSRDQIKEKAKLEGRSFGELLASEKTAIQDYDDKIKARHESKDGLTPQDEKDKTELEHQLYYDQQPVNLQEDTRSLYERIFDVTIKFHRRGFVTIQLDKNPAWTWKNAGIAKLKSYNTMLPRDCRVIIHNEGGAFGVVVGRPKFKSNGLLYSTDIVLGADVDKNLGVTPGFSIDPGDYVWNFDADFVSTSINAAGTFVGTGPYGTRVECKVVQVMDGKNKPKAAAGGPNSGNNGTLSVPSKYQLQIELFSDPAGIYTPEIHYINWQVLAGAVPALGGLIYDSLPSNNHRAAQDVVDIVSQEAEDASAVYEAHIKDVMGAANLPLDVVRCEANLSVISMWNGETIPLVSHGIVKRQELQERKGLQILNQLFRVFPNFKSRTIYHIVGLEELLNKPVRWAIPGNNKFPNDYVVELLKCAGARPEEYATIPAGDMGIKKLPLAPAGERPDIHPDKSATFWEFINDLFAKHCPGWRFVVRPFGFSIEPDIYRDMTATFQYSTCKPNLDLYAIKKGFQVYQDTTDYYTEALFTGQKDPQTGKRFAATKKIPEALDSRYDGHSLLYVGDNILYEAPIDESLGSYEACVLAARSFMFKKARPPWYVVLPVFYNPFVRCGDLITVDGLRVSVENIQRGSLKVDRGTLPVMTVTARFFDDVTVPLPGLPPR